MSLTGRNLVTIDDFSNSEIEAVFSLAGEMEGSIAEQYGLCRGKIMASLFFEPSTRTRLSFEAAMHRLGGNVIGVSDIKATSFAKGESIADMARIVGSYADIIVIRHPWEGAAAVVAEYAGVPVINAGDGGHQHPTQTLCDLYTIKQKRQTIRLTPKEQQLAGHKQQVVRAQTVATTRASRGLIEQPQLQPFQNLP